MGYHEEAYITPEVSPEGREEKTSVQISMLVSGFIGDTSTGTIDDIINEISEDNTLYDATKHGRFIYIEGKRNYVIDMSAMEGEDGSILLPNMNIFELESKIQEDISGYNERLLHLDIMQESIQDCLGRNAEEMMGSIGSEDIISEGPLEGMGVTEAILVFRRYLQDITQYHALVSLDRQEYNMSESFDQFYDFQEYYLTLALGIGDDHESLTSVIPKTIDEMSGLINLVVARRSIPEIFIYMSEIHALMDDNEYQSSTVKKNYAFFTDMLNEVVLMRLQQEVVIGTGDPFGEESEYYQDASILYNFANFVSGRTRGYEASMYLHDGVFGFEDQSRMSEDLWRPDIGNRALAMAIDIPIENEKGESISVMETIMPHLDINDPILEGREPVEVIHDCLETIIRVFPSLGITLDDGTPASADIGNSKGLLIGAGYGDILRKLDAGNLGNHNSLSLRELTEVSALARINKNLKNERSYHYGSYQLQPGEELINTFDANPGGTAQVSVVNTPGRVREMNLESFNDILRQSAEKSVEHIGSELDRSFDDTWGEIWTDTVLNTSEDWRNERRAREFGITDTNSLQYEIFTLYNDMQGNGGFGEVSDVNRGRIKTGGEILASVAGAMILGGAIISSVHLIRAINAGIKIGRVAQLSMQAQGVIYGLSGSGVSYGLDYIQGDALGFGSAGEAATGLATDFTIGGLTGGVGGLLAAKFGNPEAAFFSRANIRNQQIFAGDLTTLGLAPEMARIALLEKIYHDSEIFTPGDDPILGEVSSTMVSRLGLYGYASEEMARTYILNPNDENISPYLRDYRCLFEQFPMISLTHGDISAEYDIRFQKALAIWRLLNPEQHLNLIQVLPGIENVLADGGDIEVVNEKTLNLITQWIEIQESRLENITIQ